MNKIYGELIMCEYKDIKKVIPPAEEEFIGYDTENDQHYACWYRGLKDENGFPKVSIFIPGIDQYCFSDQVNISHWMELPKRGIADG